MCLIMTNEATNLNTYQQLVIVECVHILYKVLPEFLVLWHIVLNSWLRSILEFFCEIPF